MLADKIILSLIIKMKAKERRKNTHRHIPTERKECHNENEEVNEMKRIIKKKK